MEVILKQDVDKLGSADDIVKVRDGYANNYLIPKGFATVATISAKKVHAENLKQRAHKEEKLKDVAVKIAKELENKIIKVGAKTSTTGKIFGSVNTIQLTDAINKKGFELEKKQISIKEEPIKEVGTYTAIIKLHRDVKIELPFEVVAE